MKSWNAATPALPAPCFWRFNGATTMKSWNAQEARTQAKLAEYRFNGATTMKSWNAYRPLAQSHRRVQLQWSHDDEVVECSAVRSLGSPE